MSTRNLFALIVVTVATTTCTQVQAGFGDWLFGRSTTPYAVGYTPYAAGYAPYAAGYAPTSTQQYASGYPALTYPAQVQSFNNPSVYTGRPVVMAPGAPRTAYRLPIGGSAAPIGGLTAPVPVTSGMNSAYRPVLGSGVAQTNYSAPVTSYSAPVTSYSAPVTSYSAPVTGYAAPVTGIGSGLTFAGRPVSGGEVPLGRVLRRANTSSNPFYGTGNIYPNNFGPTTQPTLNYQAAYPSVAQAAALNTTGLAPSVSPMFPNAPQPQVGGLARFFGSLLGTRYRSSYSPAQVTYYRPQTSVDPVLGTTVTVQQPCSSYVQQLQRTPYNTLQPYSGVTPIGGPTPVGGSGCQGAACQNTLPLAQAAPSSFNQSNPYSAQPYVAQPYSGQPNGSLGYGPVPVGPPTALGSGVEQVGGVSSPSDRDVVPIPSTQPTPGYFQRNTAPLTGSSDADLQDTGQPRLQSARPRTEDTYRDGLFRSDVSPYADEDKQYKSARPREIEPSPSMQERLNKPSLPELNYPASNNSPLQTRQETQYQGAPYSDPQLPPPNWQPRKPSADPTDLVQQTPTIPTDVTAATETYSDMRPIRAPDDFKSPFQARDYSTLKLPTDRIPARATDEPRLFAPQLPTAKLPPLTATRNVGETNRPLLGVTVPIREATTRGPIRQTTFERTVPAPPKTPVRESGGWLPMSTR